jgi:NDP-sugar pyrophosphorylase family protein
MKVIITTSGIGSRLGNITNYTNKSLVNVGDKFAIDYIFDLYKHLKNINFIITLGHKGDFVKQYLTLAYPNLLSKIKFITIDLYKGPGSSLGYSLLQAKEFLDEPFIFHCCDTIILDKLNLNFKENTLLVYKKNNSAQYSTINVLGDYIKKINNKGENVFDFIYVGVAYIKDFKLFWHHLKKIYNEDINYHQLSDVHVYMLMLKTTKFIFKVIDKYFDIGNQTDYSNNLKKIEKRYNVLFKLRESISFHNDKVIKFFYDKEINLKRIQRTKFLGKNIPQIYGHTDNFHSMELINSKPLSDIYKHGLIYKLLNWANKNLWIKIEEEYNEKKFFKLCHQFYYDKTINRKNMFLNSEINKEYNIINGVNTGSINDLLKNTDFLKLSNAIPTFFHGDFILDNLLINNNDFILIDWRQEFGDSVKYGDKYYDLAKLRHNIYFNHKNILENLFFIKEINGNECNLDLKCNFFLIKQICEFDKFVKENNLDLIKIKILTAIIWINMAPLHDYPLSNFLFNFGKYNLYLANEYR